MARECHRQSANCASHPLLRILTRKNVLAGLMFVGIAAFGLWVSRNYPVGTALRMSTGYVPRLLCWLLMGLGAVVLVQGLRETDPAAPPSGRAGRARAAAADRGGDREPHRLRADAGAARAGAVDRAAGRDRELATRELKAWETAAAAAGLIVLSWAIFILGLGLPIPVWPDW